MKRPLSILLAALLALSLWACQSIEKKWQEQYDTGMRYLSELNYEEAIVAFTAAIEIDPKNVDAYIGRGGAYILSGETLEHLAAAEADYRAVIEINPANPDAYLGLADVYIRRGEYSQARELLESALEPTGNDPAIVERLEQIRSGIYADSSGKTRRSEGYEDGVLKNYWLYTYDERGNEIQLDCYNGEDVWQNTETFEYNDQNQAIRSVQTHDTGTIITTTYEYGSDGRLSREIEAHTMEDGTALPPRETAYIYDDVARTETRTSYNEEGAVDNQFVIQKDENGRQVSAIQYFPDENGELYIDYYVEYIWNADGSYGGYQITHVNQEEGAEG